MLKWKYDKIVVEKNILKNISKDFGYKKRRKNVQNIFKVNPCSKFEHDISENGWVIRFLLYK